MNELNQIQEQADANHAKMLIAYRKWWKYQNRAEWILCESRTSNKEWHYEQMMLKGSPYYSMYKKYKNQWYKDAELYIIKYAQWELDKNTRRR